MFKCNCTQLPSYERNFGTQQLIDKYLDNSANANFASQNENLINMIAGNSYC